MHSLLAADESGDCPALTQSADGEAMAAFLDHVFARDDVDRLIADVDPRNRASLALLARHGFVETGRAKATWHTHIGSCDSVYLELTKAAFRGSR